MAAGVKSEFFVHGFGDLPKDYGFTKKYSNSIMWYQNQKNSASALFLESFSIDLFGRKFEDSSEDCDFSNKI